MTLNERIRKLASETAVYGVSSIFGRLINFLLFPFYSNIFSPDEFGPVIVIYAAFVFLNILYQYGMESAYLKYAADSGDEASRSTVFSTSVWSLAATSILFSVAVILFQRPVGSILGLATDSRFLLYYAAGILVLDTISVVPYAELRLQNRPWYFAFVRTAGILVNISANLILILGFSMGIEAIFIANLAASAVSLLLLLPVFWSRLRFSFGRPLLRELLRFGLPFIPGGLGYALSERVNILFLAQMPADRIKQLYPSLATDPGLAEKALTSGSGVYAEHIVGAYGGIIKLAIVMALAVQMFRYAWQPFFLQHARDRDAPELFSRIFTVLTAALLFVFLAVSFFADDLVSIPLPGDRYLIAPQYWLGLAIIPIALLGYVFQGWYYHFSAGVYIEKQTRYFVVCTLAGSLVALGLNILFVPQYGMVAAAWATSLSYAVMAVLLFTIVRRFYPVSYAWTDVFLLIAVAALLFYLWTSVLGSQSILIESGLLLTYGLICFGLLKWRRPREDGEKVGLE
jgi:O-antigen/teichoic acid export membrane protein